MNISLVNLLNFKSSVQKNTRYSESKGSNSTSPTYANASAEILRANYCPQLSSKGKGEDRLGRSQEKIEEKLIKLKPDYNNETTVGDLLEQRGYRSPEEVEEMLRTLKEPDYDDETTVGDLLEQRGYRSPEEVEEMLKILNEPSNADTIKRKRSPEEAEEMLKILNEPSIRKRSPEEVEEMLKILNEPDYDDETTVGDLLEQRGYKS